MNKIIYKRESEVMIYMKKSIKLNVLVVVCMVSILFGNLNLKNVDAKKHITLSKKSVTLKKGKMIKVRLIGAAAKKVKWRSLNKRVAVVKNGKIMASRSYIRFLSLNDCLSNTSIYPAAVLFCKSSFFKRST